MTPEPATLPGTMPVAAALAFFREGAEHRSYPVVDEQGRLLGLVSRTDALRWQGSDYPASATLAETLSDDSQPFAFPDSPSGASPTSFRCIAPFLAVRQPPSLSCPGFSLR